MILDSNFSFNRAGQGCFYTGKISIENNIYFLCYDCGTLSSVKESLLEDIDMFKSEIVFNKSKLNLLILSHFDNDHVNHVKYLTDGIECETVIIPYLSLIERIIIAITTEDLDDDYLEFLRNPYDYLRNLGFKDIVVVLHSDNNDEIIGDFPIEPDNKEPRFDYNLRIHLKKITPDITDSIKSKEMNSEVTAAALQNVYFYSDAGFVSIFYAWMFKFYALSRPLAETNKFKQLLSIFLKKSPRQRIKSEDLLILFNKLNIKAIQSLYKTSFKGQDILNSTSLIVLHMPFSNFKNLFYYNNPTSELIYGSPYFYFNFGMRKGNLRNATLLLGDINLLKNYDEIKNHFIKELGYVNIFQIPHHGSFKNWNNIILKDLVNCESFIINFGIGNRYGHPSIKVLYDVLQSQHIKGLILNNEFLSFKSFFHLIYS